MNVGMIQAVEELAENKKKQNFEFISHKDAIFSGAIGAALWGGYRHHKLLEKNSAVVVA